MTRYALLTALFAGSVAASTAGAQATGSAPAGSQVTIPPIDFSGVILANYQYRTDLAGPQNFNKFDVERAYLTFKMPAGERTSIRITTDIFQQQNAASAAFYAGWVARLKYAYVQYDYLKTANWSANARFGLLQTVVFDHEENFWPRWIAMTSLEHAGFFSSSDAGIATTVALPHKLGEFYGTITNGPGYAARETDRFKDFAARLSITPLAHSQSKLLTTFTISPWIYRGATASKFAGGGAGQVGPVGSGNTRDRWGIFAGLRDPRLVLGAHFAQNTQTYESGLNTPVSPRVANDSTGRVVSLYTVVKPFASGTSAAQPLGLVLRWDKVTPVTSSAAPTPAYHFLIGGLIWDLSKRTSMSFDYQEQIPDAGAPPITTTKTFFAHVVANF